MEKPKTQAELRHEAFEKHAQIARDIGDAALSQIDEALEAERLFENWIATGDSSLAPGSPNSTNG